MGLFSDHILGLLTFTGRERRQPFWLWILIIYIGQMVISTVGMMPIMASFSEKLAPLSQRAQSDPTYFDQHPDVIFRTMSQVMMPAMQMMIAMAVVVSLIMTAMITAAVVRRLHDSDRSGWWAAPHLALQVAMPVVYAAMLPDFFGVFDRIRPDLPPEQINAVMAPMFRWFVPIWGIGMIDFVMMIVLIVFLCQPSADGANRFGSGPS